MRRRRSWPKVHVTRLSSTKIGRLIPVQQLADLHMRDTSSIKPFGLELGGHQTGCLVLRL
jgi:hypothetical protein